MRALKGILILIVITNLSAVASAEEHGAAKEADKKIAPPTSEQELQELQGHVQSFKAKIDNREKEIKELGEQSEKTEDPAKKSEIAQKLVIEHSELQKEIKEYNNAVYRLKYQFPERSSSKLSEEKMKEIKSLRELEEQNSIEGRIKKNMKTIRQHYGKKDPKAVKADEKPKEPKTSEPTDPLVQPKIIRQ